MVAVVVAFGVAVAVVVAVVVVVVVVVGVGVAVVVAVVVVMKVDCESCRRILDRKSMLIYEGYLICPQCQLSTSTLEKLVERRKREDEESMRNLS